MDVVVDGVSVSEGGVLPQELLDARNQFQFFLCRQILILVEQKLELVLQAPNQLVKGHLVLIIGQLGQLLHSSHGLVTAKHDSVQDLRHDEEVVDLLAEHVLNAEVVQNFKLAALDGDLRGSLPSASCLIDEKLLVELLFNLLELVEKEPLFFGSRACFLISGLCLQVSHHEACLVWIALEISSLSLACP